MILEPIPPGSGWHPEARSNDEPQALRRPRRAFSAGSTRLRVRTPSLIDRARPESLTKRLSAARSRAKIGRSVRAARTSRRNAPGGATGPTFRTRTDLCGVLVAWAIAGRVEELEFESPSRGSSSPFLQSLSTGVVHASSCAARWASTRASKSVPPVVRFHALGSCRPNRPRQPPRRQCDGTSVGGPARPAERSAAGKDCG